MKIKELVTPEQYAELKKEYSVLVKNKEITFFQFVTGEYYIKNLNRSEVKEQHKPTKK